MVCPIEPSERRLHRRLAPEEWPPDVRGRIRPGHQVHVVNLSPGGALIETTRRLTPGGTAELHLETTDARHATRVSIVRCYVSRLLPDSLVFRSALAFEQLVPWLASDDPAAIRHQSPAAVRDDAVA